MNVKEFIQGWWKQSETELPGWPFVFKIPIFVLYLSGWVLIFYGFYFAGNLLGYLLYKL